MIHVLYENLTRDQFLRLPPTEPPLEYVQGQVLWKRKSPVIFEGLTLDQFLQLPETKPALEYIDGKVAQKVSPKTKHSIIQTMFSARLVEFARPRRLGLPYIELRCTFGGRSLVPDLSFFARGRIPKDKRGQLADDVFLPPDLIVEIISPGQTIKNLSSRLSWCVRNGVRLAWLIQPTRQRVLIFRPSRTIQALHRGDVLAGEDVLPGFRLPVAEIFDWLYEE